MAANTDRASDGKPVDADGDKPANIPAATGIDPSGAPNQVVPDVDMSHPAVDANPRAGTTVDQNKIDFNDPTLSGADAVTKALNEQGVPTKSGADAAASVKSGK